jgi:hypothetical protein
LWRTINRAVRARREIGSGAGKLSLLTILQYFSANVDAEPEEKVGQ